MTKERLCSHLSSAKQSNCYPKKIITDINSIIKTYVPFKVVVFYSIFGCYGDIVEHTEAASLETFRMVTWRPYHSNSSLILPSQHTVHHLSAT